MNKSEQTDIVERLSDQTSWIVGNGDGTKWRCWRDGFSRWTTNRDEAVRYARREDAEAAHAEDEDAWRVEPFVAGNPLIAERDAAIARADKAEAALATAINGSGIVEAIEEHGGWWKPCSGCYETNEGYPTGPYNSVLKCDQGGGCSECGGLGAVWDHYSEEQIEDLVRASLTEDERT